MTRDEDFWLQQRHDDAAFAAEQRGGLARMAECTMCPKQRPSSIRAELAFFRERPDQETDTFYCGCGPNGFD